MSAPSRVWRIAENGIAFLALGAIILLPFADGLIRIFFSKGIASTTLYVRHAVLVLAFIGAVIATRERRHLGLASGESSLAESQAARRLAALREGFAAMAASFVCAALLPASLSFSFVAFGPGELIGILPARLFALIMPLGYLVCSLRFALDSRLSWRWKTIASAGILLGLFLGSPAFANAYSLLTGSVPAPLESAASFASVLLRTLRTPLFIAIVASAVAGTPLFAVLGGAAFFLFGGSGVPLETIPQEAYSFLQDATIPAIPLFTLAGFFLAEGSSGERLVALAQRLLGRLPGGTIITAVIACAFFSTFTGATGVTILALGGLLSFVLVKADGRSVDSAHGLLTAVDSIGLLFPPSLAVIVYAVTMQVDVIKLFLASLLPGILIAVATIIAGILITGKGRIPPAKLQDRPLQNRNEGEGRSGKGRGLLGDLKRSWFELLLPALIAGGYFSGAISLADTGALAVVLLAIVAVAVRKDIPVANVPGIVLKALATAGGVLIILASARGLSSFIIDASIPDAIATWVRSFVSSPFVFLLLVNVGLLVTGCFMDVFSATLVVAPLLAPLAEGFGIDPLRLGVIFLANMGIGFLTPPIGMNLFMGSYAFKRPVSELYRLVLPYFLVQLACMLLITYVPFLSTALLPR